MSLTTIVTSNAGPALTAEHWHGPGGWWPLFPLAWLLLLAGVALALVVVTRRNRDLAGRRAGELRLAERFAAGEITEQEYRDRLAVLKEQVR